MKRLDDRVDLQVSLLLAVFVAVVTLTCFGVSYNVTYRDMKFSLRERVEYIRDHLESRLDLSAFPDIESREDMDREEYRTIHEVFSNVKEAAGTMYLYTAKKNTDGRYVYVIDGLDPNSEDFRYPGDPIEEEIYQEMDRALSGEEVYPDEIVHTSWGDIFICYLPLYSGRKIVGVLGIEFEAAHQYKTYQKLKIFVPIAVVFFTLLAFWVSRRMFLHINEIVKRQNEQKEILAEALHNAELASKAKSSFLFNISHDIQTPMNAIIGFARLAKDHVDDRRQVLDYLRKVERAGSHLRRLINDVLDMARLEKGSLELELAPCDIRVSVRETEQLFRSRMEEKGLSFDVRLEELRQSYVFCDSLRMKQIALNLLSNALEYTKAGGSVVYEIRQTGTDPEGYVYLEMRIRDTGVGMSEEFQKHIFGVFEREKSSTESGVQGTGLGLAITRQLVELQGGTIEVNSKKGEGTEFIIRLKLKIAEEEDFSDKKQEKKGFEGKRLLLVEDNPLNQEVARTLLAEEGFVIECAGDGLEALEMVSGSVPGYYDLILMDIQMPRMDGYQASKEIRNLANPELARIPIVALTANAFEEDKKEAFASGMDGHMAKPFDLEKAMGILEEILGRTDS